MSGSILSHAVRPLPGRGALSNAPGRFETLPVLPVDDGWDLQEEPGPAPGTSVQPDAARSVLTRNRSPDVPFNLSVNPYRGCEHGCSYCFARPTHSYLDLSPGRDFETRLFYKRNAAQRLREELAAPGYRCEPIGFGTNTDPYQPVERELKVMRSLLEVCLEARQPVTIVTKGSLVLRDLDLLETMAGMDLVHVAVSVTTLDDDLKRRLEPRAASPGRRLAVIRALAGVGVPVNAMVAPVIPALTDHELEAILSAVADAGASGAGWVLLRLPDEVDGLFREWLQHHAPGRAEHVLSLMRQLHAGRSYDSTFGRRQRGQGVYADLLARRFSAACRRLGLATRSSHRLDCSRFRPPGLGGQLSLLD